MAEASASEEEALIHNMSVMAAKVRVMHESTAYDMAVDEGESKLNKADVFEFFRVIDWMPLQKPQRPVPLDSSWSVRDDESYSCHS